MLLKLFGQITIHFHDHLRPNMRYEIHMRCKINTLKSVNRSVLAELTIQWILLPNQMCFSLKDCLCVDFNTYIIIFHPILPNGASLPFLLKCW